MMTVICAWCDPPKQIGMKPGVSQDGSNIVTHGICQECLDKVLGKGETQMEKVIIYVKGGVAEVASKTTNVQVEILDFDNDGCDGGECIYSSQHEHEDHSHEIDGPDKGTHV